ncbi:putative reverse transcriptase domain-containing protein, partial [Tanacetum coccineum]
LNVRESRRPREGNDKRVDELNGRGNDQGRGTNGGVNGANGNGNVGNVIVNGNRVGCSYKEFLACNPKEYDGKGGVVALTRWIEKMEFMHDMSGCSIDQKVKYTAGSFVKPSDLGFKYEIEIASGQLVEIDKVIKGCKLEIEGHIFDIDLIPFGHGSFDVIIGMDWLSNYKAEIICHEKVVRIPLPDGNMLRVLGERPEEKVFYGC